MEKWPSSSSSSLLLLSSFLLSSFSTFSFKISASEPEIHRHSIRDTEGQALVVILESYFTHMHIHLILVLSRASPLKPPVAPWLDSWNTDFQADLQSYMLCFPHDHPPYYRTGYFCTPTPYRKYSNPVNKSTRF